MIKRIILAGALLAACFCTTLRAEDTNAPAATTNAVAAADAAKKADPDINQRVADLEAYVGNGARGSDAADSKVSSKLDGVAGPGHNAWMMTSAVEVICQALWPGPGDEARAVGALVWRAPLVT